jgi:hypothetical protein
LKIAPPLCIAPGAVEESLAAFTESAAEALEERKAAAR